MAGADTEVSIIAVCMLVFESQCSFVMVYCNWKGERLKKKKTHDNGIFSLKIKTMEKSDNKDNNKSIGNCILNQPVVVDLLFVCYF